MPNSGFGGFIEKNPGFRKSIRAERRMRAFAVAGAGRAAYIGGTFRIGRMTDTVSANAAPQGATPKADRKLIKPLRRLVPFVLRS
jgi:hypothetical protein